MQPLQDESAFEWIRKIRGVLLHPEEPRLSPINEPGIFVSDLVPHEFEAYAKILHRLDACYDDIDNPLSLSEQKIIGISGCEPLKSFVQDRRAKSVGPRIRWQEMAALLKLPYMPEINFAWFGEKMDAWCVRRLTKFSSAWPAGEEGEELSSILINLYGRQQCFFRLPSHFIYNPRKEPMLYSGSLDQVIDFLKARPRTGFEYWWPVDHQWCVCSDDEVGATVVGGPRNLISSLLESRTMECLEVSLTTRVDVKFPYLRFISQTTIATCEAFPLSRVRTSIFLDSEFLSKAKELTGITETPELIHKALQSFIERESARRLADVGGSMPKLENVPRRRSKISRSKG